VLSVRVKKGWPVGFEPTPAGLTTPGAAVTPRPPCVSGDDRNRTGDRSPDKRVLLPSELRPQGKGHAGSAGAAVPIARAGFEPAVSSS